MADEAGNNVGLWIAAAQALCSFMALGVSIVVGLWSRKAMNASELSALTSARSTKASELSALTSARSLSWSQNQWRLAQVAAGCESLDRLVDAYWTAKVGAYDEEEQAAEIRRLLRTLEAQCTSAGLDVSATFMELKNLVTLHMFDGVEKTPWSKNDNRLHRCTVMLNKIQNELRDHIVAIEQSPVGLPE